MDSAGFSSIVTVTVSNPRLLSGYTALCLAVGMLPVGVPDTIENNKSGVAPPGFYAPQLFTTSARVCAGFE